MSAPSTPRLIARRADVTAAAERATNRGLRLRVAGSHAVEIARSCGIGAVALDRPEDFDGDLLLTSPVVSPAVVEQLRLLAKPLTLTVDHYSQVEFLSAIEWTVIPKLLIELALGPARFGGRPGRDAVDLAQAIEQSAGVTFGGVSAAVSSSGMADSLLRTAEQIEAAGIVVPLVSAAAGSEELDGLPSGHEVRQAVAPVCLATRVLSRPSLETCVINAGTANGVLPKASLRLGRSPQRPESDASVRAVEEGRSLLTIAGESVEALIGDEVFVFGVERPMAAGVDVV